MDICYFLEDIGHERFLLALCRKVFAQQQIATHDIHEDVRNSSGGKARVRGELEIFLREYSKLPNEVFDIVIVANDTDCQGENRVRKQLETLVERSLYLGTVVFAIPDPYIEAWYLADPNAVQQAVESPGMPKTPGRKCRPELYKKELRDVFREVGIVPALGGVEYAQEIVNHMNLYVAGQNVPSLGRFLEDLRSAVQQINP